MQTSHASIPAARVAVQRERSAALPQLPAPTTTPGYGRARLWLGISAVGTMVTAATLALLLGLPQSISSAFSASLIGQWALLGCFILAYAALQLPFDLLGGYLLPKRYGRTHPSFGAFVTTLLRGVGAHAVWLMIIAITLLAAGRSFGVAGVVSAAIVISMIGLIGRLPLARVIAPLRSSDLRPSPIPVGDASLPVECLTSDDEGYTGGIVGLLRARRTIIPERWLTQLDAESVEIIRRRRAIAIESGSWRRGRVVAMLFTWIGMAASATIVGGAGLGQAAGILEFSLYFTLWSFIGLLILPTISRAGVAEVDALLRAEHGDARAIDETIRRLDALQDAETDRPSGVELIFHPIPSVRNRLDGPTRARPRGALDAARTAIFLSASGLGLLGRAVHCNCGRPALWVFLPSD